MGKKHYGAIDGLRTIAALGIVMMHIQANTSYKISGYLYERIIPEFTNFVFLFMVISAFGMCCGYYEKVLNNEISISEFYKRRFLKTLPFFGILVIIDLLMSPSVDSFAQAFADLTLLFGFLPNAGDIEVIGVGWFLGLVFVFYLCFPFFCFLIETKKRAWFSFFISLIYNFLCANYFEIDRRNILYSACFFLAGGLFYLYRDEISKINKFAVLAGVWLTVILYYTIGGNTITLLLVSVLLLMYVTLASKGVLQNKLTKFLSGISMEIYLSHMLMFRVVEKTGLHTVLGDGWIQYIVTVVLVFAGTVIFSFVMKCVIERVEGKLAGRSTAGRKIEK